MKYNVDRGRSMEARIERLRTRLREARTATDIINVLKGILDLLEDEL